MARHDTMNETHFRVRVINTAGRVTHESWFRDERSARDYYETLAPELGTLELQTRAAGTHRYKTVARVPAGSF